MLTRTYEIAVIKTSYCNRNLLLHIHSHLYILDCVYNTYTGSRPGEAYGVNWLRVHCTVNLYCLNEELKFLYNNKQIPNEQLYRAHLECASQGKVCGCV